MPRRKKDNNPVKKVTTKNKNLKKSRTKKIPRHELENLPVEIAASSIHFDNKNDDSKIDDNKNVNFEAYSLHRRKWLLIWVIASAVVTVIFIFWVIHLENQIQAQKKETSIIDSLDIDRAQKELSETMNIIKGSLSDLEVLTETSTANQKSTNTSPFLSEQEINKNENEQSLKSIENNNYDQ